MKRDNKDWLVQAMLGRALINGNFANVRLSMSSILSLSPQQRAVYEAMENLAAQSSHIDVASVCDMLSRMGVSDEVSGGPAFVASLTDYVPLPTESH